MDYFAMVRSSGENSNISLSKVGMAVGGAVASWVVIHQTLAGTLTLDTFDTYLYCMLGANTINKGISVLKAIKGASSNVTTNTASGSDSQ